MCLTHGSTLSIHNVPRSARTANKPVLPRGSTQKKKKAGVLHFDGLTLGEVHTGVYQLMS